MKSFSRKRSRKNMKSLMKSLLRSRKSFSIQNRMNHHKMICFLMNHMSLTIWYLHNFSLRAQNMILYCCMSWMIWRALLNMMNVSSNQAGSDNFSVKGRQTCL